MPSPLCDEIRLTSTELHHALKEVRQLALTGQTGGAKWVLANERLGELATDFHDKLHAVSRSAAALLPNTNHISRRRSA